MANDGPNALVRDLLLFLAYVRQHPGAKVAEVARHLRIPQKQVTSFVDDVLMCGKPPFAPDDLVDVWIDGDAIHVQLDQGLGRPLRLA